MAPVPVKSKKKPQQSELRNMSVSNVYDNLGRSLDSLLRKQTYTNRSQDQKSTVNRQHAAQYESSISNNKLIYRDVFPGRKYRLTLNDTTWMGGSSVVTIGYTVGDAFTQISSTAEAPERNVFDINIPIVAAVDTLEIRLIGATSTIRGYLEDNTSGSGISGVISQIIESISGHDGLTERIAALEEAVGIPYSNANSLDSRVSDLEDA